MSKENEPVGTIISRMDSPSPSSVDFVVTKGIVHRGQYVETDYSEGTMIALVTDVVKTNRYFERADSVKEFENSGTELFEQFPTGEWEYLVAKTRPLGVFNANSIRRSTFPPSPGTKVSIASKENLKKFFRFDEENGLLLGKIEHHDVEVKPGLNALLKRHLSILAMSGFGKSFLVSCLIEELLDRKKEHGRIAVVALDPHGEYTSFALQPKDKNKNDYSAKTKIVRAREMKIGVPKLSVPILSNIIPGLSAAQKREFERIISRLNKEMREGLGPYGLEELKQSIVQDKDMNENTRSALIAWILSLQELRLFSKTDNPGIFDVIKPGQLTVVDLSDIIDLRKKQIIVSYFAQRLFFERRKKTVPPFLLIVEEAHQFCLSEDTEILTLAGWKKYSEINVGDLAFSYNKDNGKLEPSPIERVIVKDHDGEMIRLYNEDSIDALVTGDHRVLCYVRATDMQRKWKWSEPRFISAKNLPTAFKIPVVADVPSNSICNIDEDLIKILGWIITDGWPHFYHNRKQSYFEISQATAKGQILEEMKQVMQRRFLESKIYTRQRVLLIHNNKSVSHSEENTFYLGKNVSDEIKTWLGIHPHRIPRKFLENASPGQLKIMFEALAQGDGNESVSRINRHRYIAFHPGYDVGLANDFQELCVRLGYSAVQKSNPSSGLKILVSFRRKYASIRKATKEYYRGKTWDITVKNGAFVVRRNGRVFITGNCPERAIAEQSVSKGIMRTIAREGRKFGASLCLVSQRPIQLDTTTLSQCSTNIILRITNPYDLDHIGKSAEALDKRSMDMITSLRVGEALLVGEAASSPVFFSVRQRKSMESQHEISLEKAATDFEQGKEKQEQETEEFL